MDIHEFAQQFIAFAKANGVMAEPEIIQHEVTRIPGFVEQYYLRYTRPDGEEHEISLNVSLTGGSGQKDAEMRGLRAFFGLSERLAMIWDRFTRSADAPKPNSGPIVEPAKSPIGPELKPGCHRNMFSDFPPGVIYIESGVKYVYVAETPFLRYWQRTA